MNLYALIMHDDHDIDQSLYEKKKKRRFSDLPSLCQLHRSARSWPMQIQPNPVKGSLYVMIKLLKMTDVS